MVRDGENKVRLLSAIHPDLLSKKKSTVMKVVWEGEAKNNPKMHVLCTRLLLVKIKLCIYTISAFKLVKLLSLLGSLKELHNILYYMHSKCPEQAKVSFMIDRNNREPIFYTLEKYACIFPYIAYMPICSNACNSPNV